MSPLQKIRTSFSIQLMLWVAGFVMVTLGVVICLFVRFSEDVIRDETIDTTMQALENSVLRIDNTLRQQEMTARLEGRPLRVNRALIERFVKESGSESILQQSLPGVRLFVARRDSGQLDALITGAESGYRRLLYEGEDMYLFTHPVGGRQFSLTAVCPVEDIDGRSSRIDYVQLAWGIGAFLLLLYILYMIIAAHLCPLNLLADAAQRIADGNLDTPIPDSHHEHETGRLQSSLKKMQRSLRAYMGEMKQKQATLSAQNAELQAAYGEAQDYERKKARFLSEMTSRMAAPVNQLCLSTNTMCRDYEKLSKDDMARLQASILHGTEEITELLDQLIKETADA